MFSVRLSILWLALAAGAVLAAVYPGSPAADAQGGAVRSCAGLDPPSGGSIGAGFAPGPNWSGHWGVDFAADPGAPVRAAASGEVTFSGYVAENLAVTVDHGGGLKTSYSSLGTALAAPGQRVSRGEVIGLAGGGEAGGGVHFSVRIDGEYIDPEPLLGCAPREPYAGLRLLGSW